MGGCEHVLKFNGPVNYGMIENKHLFLLIGNTQLSVVNADSYHHIATIQLENIVATTFFVSQGLVFLANAKNKIDIFLYENPKLTPKGQMAGHDGWILTMKRHENYLYTGSDDKKIKVWNISDNSLLEEFNGHEDGVVSLEFCDGNLYSGSFDHSIRSWDLKEMDYRIVDRKRMFREDILSKKYETFMSLMFKKGKKKKGKKKK